MTNKYKDLKTGDDKHTNSNVEKWKYDRYVIDFHEVKCMWYSDTTHK